MKTVIEMAHETLERMNADEHCREQYWSATDDELQAFADLVRADEREACAKLADKVEYCGACESDVARAIRAMGSRAVGNRAYDRYEGDNT
jgi:hypothetical protein